MASQRLKARVGSACTARFKYGLLPDLSDGAFTAPQTISGAPLIAEATVSGLTADTIHYARCETNGRLVGDIAKFRTAPAAGARSFRFVMGTCTQSLMSGVEFDQMLATDPLFMLHMGDAFYEDPDTSSAATMRGYYDTRWLPAASHKARRFYRQVPLEYVFDGHDCYVTDAPNVALPAVQQVYREYVPHRSLPDAAGVWRAFTIGRVRFVLTDYYSHRSDASDPDGPSKSLLGATQKQWWKDELDDAWPVHGCPVVCWGSSWSTNGTNGLRWDDYATERQELFDHIADNGHAGHVFMLSGDDHALRMDDGTNNDFSTSGSDAPVPILVSAPINSNGNHSLNTDGPYSEGTLDTGNYFSLVTITDTGGSTITMDWSGRQSDAAGVEVMVMQHVIAVP